MIVQAVGMSLIDEGIITEEEQLAKVVAEIGSFIAIGRPGENLPTLGAIRLYTGDADWQESVLDRPLPRIADTKKPGSMPG